MTGPEEVQRAPGRRLRIFLVVGLATLLGLELAYRGYLRFVASPDEYSRYMPFSEVPPRQLVYRGHP